MKIKVKKNKINKNFTLKYSVKIVFLLKKNLYSSSNNNNNTSVSDKNNYQKNYLKNLIHNLKNRKFFCPFICI